MLNSDSFTATLEPAAVAVPRWSARLRPRWVYRSVRPDRYDTEQNSVRSDVPYHNPYPGQRWTDNKSP